MDSAPRPAAAPEAARSPGDPVRALCALAWGRLAVAALALPLGLLLRPDATEPARKVLAAFAVAILALTALFALAARTRRLLAFQVYLQVGADLVLVTALAALTGGVASQFLLFYVLVAIAGGLLARVPGGLFAAAGAAAGYFLLPWLSWRVALAPPGGPPAVPGGMLLAFVATVGVLAGVLGRRVRVAHDDLLRTRRELHRVRVDNDIILRHLASGVLTVDAWGTVAYLNPAAEQVLGLRTADVRGRALEDALPARLGLLREIVQGSLVERQPRLRAELTVKDTAGGERVLGVTTNLLRHEEAVTGVVAVFQDLTEVRAMERRARRNETLAEVGALAAGIAHELRNGLNPISGSVEFLERELKPEGESAVLLQLIVRECARLNRFVTDLLAYARERDLVLEPVDLDAAMDEVRDGLLRDPRRANVRIAFDPAEPGLRLRGDREQLRQVWLNLVNNALDAMASGGTLRVSWSRTGDRAEVRFEDQGEGIAPDALARVGEPFYTTKPGGTGLGLAIAQRIVERHGGTLSLESAPGRGTVARVVLPALAETLADAA